MSDPAADKADPVVAAPAADEENKQDAPVKDDAVKDDAVKDDAVKADVDADVDDADDADKKDVVVAEEEDNYQQQLPNRVIVARNHPLSYYVDRARRILRMEDELFVSGRGNTISMACTLVEVLKRQKIGLVCSVSTCMNVEPYFSSAGDPRWSQPTAMITFKIGRGEFALYVADYHQRKVVEIFENTDNDNTGNLTFDQVETLDFSTRFKSNDDQKQQAKEFLAKLKEPKMNLPTFIKYASILIHPLLRDKVFKAILTKNFGFMDPSKMNAPPPNDAAGGGSAVDPTQ